ncbi:MAG TPA: nucleoside triphosphate pyrophosphohydrolase [Candidatus Xenobia bacterium]|nr:nucleoside triphosphate pyrophosphohydrolase [Candidatus Xenobia bacterium]
MSNRRFEEVVELMARLRGPEGCPWDREQTPLSLRSNLIEETYEVLDAIERHDPEALKEELGDLLLQVLFHAQMAKEQGRFSIDDVLTHLHDKLIRRHPHVFGEARAHTPQEALHRWETMKAADKAASQSATSLDAVSAHQPALQEAYEISRRAAGVGFEWEKFDDLLDKAREEAEELRRAQASGDKEWLEDEAGDLLFVAVNVARYLGYDPELALRRTNRRFRRRFAEVEAELARSGRRPQDATAAELNELWELVKSREPE